MGDKIKAGFVNKWLLDYCVRWEGRTVRYRTPGVAEADGGCFWSAPGRGAEVRLGGTGRVLSLTNSRGMRTVILAISLRPDQLALAARRRSLFATGMGSLASGPGRFSTGVGSLGLGIDNADYTCN